MIDRQGQKGGLYIHIPFCASRCAYCDFVSGCDLTLAPLYVDKVCEEMRLRADASFAVDTLYIGGGTPSLLPAAQIARLIDCAKKHYAFDKNPEITVEANPDSADEKFLTQCREAGVNRLSLGLQSANDALLKRVGRRHNYQQFETAFLTARRVGFDNISADLMLGLPEQTMKDVEDTVAKLLRLSPEHISIYALKVEQGTPLYEQGYAPDEDISADMYARCTELLAAYRRYEVSNFCIDDKFSRHNFKYWTRAPYYGFGAAAHSFLGDVRRENTSLVSKYLTSDLSKKDYFTLTALSRQDCAEETLMLSLRTDCGLDLAKYYEDFSIDLLKEKKDCVERLTKGGWLSVEKGRLKLTKDAYYVMNDIIVQLLL